MGDRAVEQTRTGGIACRNLEATSHPHQGGYRDYIWFSASHIFPPMEWAVLRGSGFTVTGEFILQLAIIRKKSCRDGLKHRLN